MGKKVLFSVVSDADPISKMQDGPMLHLCRYQRPDIVYLFFTEKYSVYHKKDDRYRKTIQLLGEKIGHTFTVYPILTAIQNVYRFDSFFDEFEKRYRKIFETYGNDTELIVNLSSGTAAMQACLVSLSVNSYHKITLYQVREDRKDANGKKDSPDEFQLKEYWDLNMDNEPGALNRCLAVGNNELGIRLQKEAIVEHIESYDYKEAKEIAEKIRNSIPEDVYTLLTIGNERLLLNKNRYLPIINEGKRRNPELYGDIIPFTDDRQILLYEYLLYLRIKQKKKEYAELVRGMTPLLFELSEYVIKKVGNVDIRRRYCSERRGKIYLDREKLESDEKGREYLGYLEENSGYTTGFLASWQLITIIAKDQSIESEELKSLFKDLRDKVETGIRNIASHTIVAVTDEDIKRKTSFTSEEIINKFKRIFQLSGFAITEEKWNSYDKLNEKIKSLIRM